MKQLLVVGNTQGCYQELRQVITDHPGNFFVHLGNIGFSHVLLKDMLVIGGSQDDSCLPHKVMMKIEGYNVLLLNGDFCGFLDAHTIVLCAKSLGCDIVFSACLNQNMDSEINGVRIINISNFYNGIQYACISFDNMQVTVKFKKELEE